MYNVIKVQEGTPLPCPICEKNMELEAREGEWQSKYADARGYDDELALIKIPLENVQRGEMHGMCEHCESFIQLNIENGKITGGEIR